MRISDWSSDVCSSDLLVAALGHPGDVLARPLGLETEAHRGDAERAGDLPDLVEVGVHLGAGVVDGLQGRAGKLELAARLERHAGAVLGEGEDRKSTRLNSSH